MSTDPESRNGFGPYLEGVGPTYRDGDATKTIRYGEIDDIRRALELHGKHVAAFLIEPIQGEAGIVVPPEGYFRQVRELCTQHKVLLICDEIQTVRQCLLSKIPIVLTLWIRLGPLSDRQNVVRGARRHSPGHSSPWKSSLGGRVSCIRCARG